MRFAVVLAALAAVALALAGCGSSSGSPSSLDPAQIAPANSVVYLDLTVRPEASERQGAESGLTKLIGHSPDAGIQQLIGGLLKGSHLNYQRDVKPWLGQQIGLVFTAFSRSGFAVIAPTNNSSAALSALKKGEGNASLSSHSYRGVSYESGVDSGTPIALGIVGKYAVIGAPAAFDAIVDASKGSSLESQSGFSSAFGKLPAGALARAYASGPGAIAALKQIPTLNSQVEQQLQALIGRKKIPPALTMSVSITGSAVSAEVGTVGGTTEPRSTADVSNLPGDSWIALSTGSGSSKQLTSAINGSFATGFDREAKMHGIDPNTLMNLLQQRTGINIERDLIPALGGFQLSVQGTSLLSLGLGMVLHPQDPAAAGRLLADIHNIVAHSSGLSVSGNPRSFTITKPGLPIPRIVVSQTARQVLATVDEPSSAITAPATTLSSNSAFQRAHSQLLSGSAVPLFINFGPLTSILSATPQFSSDPKAAKALAVLRRLDYLVFGFNPTAEEAQFTLGLN